MFNYFNEKIRKHFTVFDVKLLQLTAIFGVLFLAKIFPRILSLNLWFYLILAVLCMIRPLYVLLIKNSSK
ncbi:MAG: hypothetical protein DRZ79_04645 [Candidatus Cloacimonadota bacterium]|nr:MAG: hypothetical protein DRZ79_04645 [Candidatus Cloacimonadota bacterium]